MACHSRILVETSHHTVVADCRADNVDDVGDREADKASQARKKRNRTHPGVYYYRTRGSAKGARGMGKGMGKGVVDTHDGPER